MSARPDTDESPADATADAIADTGADSREEEGFVGEGLPEAAALDANDASPDAAGAIVASACGAR